MDKRAELELQSRVNLMAYQKARNKALKEIGKRYKDEVLSLTKSLLPDIKLEEFNRVFGRWSEEHLIKSRDRRLLGQKICRIKSLYRRGKISQQEADKRQEEVIKIIRSKV